MSFSIHFAFGISPSPKTNKIIKGISLQDIIENMVTMQTERRRRSVTDGGFFRNSFVGSLFRGEAVDHNPLGTLPALLLPLLVSLRLRYVLYELMTLSYTLITCPSFSLLRNPLSMPPIYIFIYNPLNLYSAWPPFSSSAFS